MSLTFTQRKRECGRGGGDERGELLRRVSEQSRGDVKKQMATPKTCERERERERRERGGEVHGGDIFRECE